MKQKSGLGRKKQGDENIPVHERLDGAATAIFVAFLFCLVLLALVQYFS
nr:hypothetical protein P9270_016045 [Mesorhizobium sp. WSM4875]